MRIQLAALLLIPGLAQSAADEWIAFRPEGAGFEVLLPAQPEHQPKTIRPDADSELTIHTYSVRFGEGKLAIVVGFHDMVSPPSGEHQVDPVLDAGANGAAANLGARVQSQHPVQLQHYAGRHFEYGATVRGRDVRAVARIFVVGQRVIHLTIMGPPDAMDDSTIARFLDSLKLVQDPGSVDQR